MPVKNQNENLPSEGILHILLQDLTGSG